MRQIAQAEKNKRPNVQSNKLSSVTQPVILLGKGPVTYVVSFQISDDMLFTKMISMSQLNFGSITTGCDMK